MDPCSVHVCLRSYCPPDRLSVPLINIKLGFLSLPTSFGLRSVLPDFRTITSAYLLGIHFSFLPPHLASVFDGDMWALETTGR